MPKFVCLDDYDTFTTTSETEARRHAADNPGHQVAEVSDTDADGELETKVIKLEESDKKEEAGDWRDTLPF